MDKRKSESTVVIKKVIYVIIIFLDNFREFLLRHSQEDHKNLSIFFKG